MLPEHVTKRTIICRKCSIYDKELDMCNANLYVNPETNDVSTSPRKGYIKGCGCHLQWKITNTKSKCPAGKW